MFFLAKELGMTIKQLTENLTKEELKAWAGFFELKHEEEEKYKEQVQKKQAMKPRRRLYRSNLLGRVNGSRVRN